MCEHRAFFVSSSVQSLATPKIQHHRPLTCQRRWVRDNMTLPGFKSRWITRAHVLLQALDAMSPMIPSPLQPITRRGLDWARRILALSGSPSGKASPATVFRSSLRLSWVVYWNHARMTCLVCGTSLVQSNRTNKSGCECTSRVRNLESAPRAPVALFSTAYTAPIPPLPICCTMRYTKR